MTDHEDRGRPISVDCDTHLSACPFCASSDIGFYEYVFAQQFAVACNRCGAQGPRRTAHEEAGRLWNRRVPG